MIKKLIPYGDDGTGAIIFTDEEVKKYGLYEGMRVVLTARPKEPGKKLHITLTFFPDS